MEHERADHIAKVTAIVVITTAIIAECTKHGAGHDRLRANLQCLVRSVVAWRDKAGTSYKLDYEPQRGKLKAGSIQ